MVGATKLMSTSFKRTFADTAVFSALSRTLLTLPLLETPGHAHTSLAQSLVGTLLLSPSSWCTQDFVGALQESVSLVLWKFCNQIPLVSKEKEARTIKNAECQRIDAFELWGWRRLLRVPWTAR